jgi:DNA-binding MarR family transcriptional regulator
VPTNKSAPTRRAAAESLLNLIATAVRQQARELSLTAISTLATLEQSGPRRITELAALEQVTQPSMTALISTLERAGLVVRERISADQRVVLAALTDEGMRYLKERRRAAAETILTLINQLSDEEVDRLIAAAPVFDHLRTLEIAARATLPTAETATPR